MELLCVWRSSALIWFFDSDFCYLLFQGWVSDFRVEWNSFLHFGAFFFPINTISPQLHQLLRLSLEHRDSFFFFTFSVFYIFFPTVLCFAYEISLQFEGKKGKRYTLEYPAVLGIRKIPQDLQQSNFSQQQYFYPNFWLSLQTVNIDQQENCSAEYCNCKSLRAAISIYILVIRESQAMSSWAWVRTQEFIHPLYHCQWSTWCF